MSAAAFTEAMIQQNCLALQRAQGACPPLAGLRPEVARAVPDSERGIRVEIRTRDNRWLPLDGDDPMKTAAERVGALTSERQIILVGLGLGYALDRLEEHGSAAKVLAFEPDPAVATLCMARRDWRSWIESGRLRVLVGPDYAGATSMARWMDVATAPTISVSPTLVRERPNSAEGARAIAERVVGDAQANADARRRFAGRYLLQTIGNLPTIGAGADVAALNGVFAQVPAVVVGAGPSLDDNVRMLAGLQDRAVIVAADTALRPLLAGGVRPHLVVGVDPAELNARHLSGIEDDLSDVWLVAEGSLHPAAFEAFAGRTFNFKVSTHEPWPWLSAAGFERATLRAWGSVVTSAFDLALHLGCDPVVFAGLDLAYTGERPYCSNTLYDKTWRDVMMAHHHWTFEELVADYFAQRVTSWEPDLHGGRVRSAPQLLSFRNWLLDQVAAAPQRRFVNATGGGVLFGTGIEHATLAEVLGERPGVPDLRERIGHAHRKGRSASRLTEMFVRKLASRHTPDSATVLDQWRAFTLDTVSIDDIVSALIDVAGRLA